MKLAGAFISIISLLTVPLMSEASSLGTLRMSLVKGDVEVRNQKASQSVTGTVNLPLMEGDEISVGNRGRVEIQSKDGSFIRLDEHSLLVIDELGTDSFKYFLARGSAYVNFSSKEDKSIVIDSPLTALSAGDSTKFGIHTSGKRNIKISVYSGVVESSDGYRSIDIEAGQDFSMGDTEYGDREPLDRRSEWLAWNRARDRLFEGRIYDTDYLPEELHPYGYELDNSGEWFYTRSYGYVWRPTVYVSAGWSPYRHGRWLYRERDYIWVSYEPWGWVPYHYGRWTYGAAHGWFWVPPRARHVYWAPAYVGWVSTPAYVAWVPLAPEDYYYGYGYYGPKSINLFTIDFRRYSTSIVYNNIYSHNAVTIVHRDSFNRGRHKHYRAKHNPFRNKSAFWGRPVYKPHKFTMKERIKRISHEQRAPRYLRDVRRERSGRHTSLETGINRAIERPLKKDKTLIKRRVVKTVRDKGEIKKVERIVRTERKGPRHTYVTSKKIKKYKERKDNPGKVKTYRERKYSSGTSRKYAEVKERGRHSTSRNKHVNDRRIKNRNSSVVAEKKIVKKAVRDGGLTQVVKKAKTERIRKKPERFVSKKEYRRERSANNHKKLKGRDKGKFETGEFREESQRRKRDRDDNVRSDYTHGPEKKRAKSFASHERMIKKDRKGNFKKGRFRRDD